MLPNQYNIVKLKNKNKKIKWGKKNLARKKKKINVSLKK